MENLKYKKIFITGGSGFLGKHIVSKLRDEKAVIFEPRRTELNLMNYTEILDYINFVIPDIIIHSAAFYGGIMINKTQPESIYFKNTIMGTNLIHAVCESKQLTNKSAKLIVIGTACCYGQNAGLNLNWKNEDYYSQKETNIKENELWNGPCHESVENYGCVKKMLWIQQRAAFNQYDINGLHLILTNLYGEGDSYNPSRSHVVAALIRKFVEAKLNNDKVVKLWGDGTPIREFLYVKDAAEAVVKSCKLENDKPLLFNVGTGIGTSIKKLAETIAKIVNFKGELVYETDKPNGIARKVLDVNLMNKTLSWQPEYTIEKGLKRTIEWYKKNKKKADEKW